jgi:hypothetical protein
MRGAILEGDDAGANAVVGYAAFDRIGPGSQRSQK